MLTKKIIACLISLLFYSVIKAQTPAQVLDYLRKNIRIYYIANPNVETPDIREIKTATIVAADNGIIFGKTDNNGMQNCARLLMALFKEKDGDAQLQEAVYKAMQLSKKPIVINFINDAVTGIDKEYLPKYNYYVVEVPGRVSAWPATYTGTGANVAGIHTAIVLGEYYSRGLQNLKDLFRDLLAKIGAGQYGAAAVEKKESGQTTGIVARLWSILKDVRESGPVSTLGELDIIPAKSMTLKEAYENIALYHQLGVINISPTPRFDKDSNVIMPQVIPKITLNKVGTGNDYIQFNYKGTHYGVSVWYNPASSPPPRTDIVQLVHNGLDARNVVAFMRMAIWLAVEKKVVQIHHTGMRGSERQDAHGEGRSVDFVGVVFDDGGTMFVGNNWATKKVLKLPGFTEQATISQWPAKSQPLHFRLDTDNADQNARSFFSDLYGFIQTQYQDKTSDRDDPGGSTIGNRSFIMHPDHYLSSQDSGSIGRETHQDHIHMQIGVTGKSN